MNLQPTHSTLASRLDFVLIAMQCGAAFFITQTGWQFLGAVSILLGCWLWLRWKKTHQPCWTISLAPFANQNLTDQGDKALSSSEIEIGLRTQPANSKDLATEHRYLVQRSQRFCIPMMGCWGLTLWLKLKPKGNKENDSYHHYPKSIRLTIWRDTLSLKEFKGLSRYIFRKYA